MVIVATLIAYGCPLQAIVAAFHLDERTVMDWQERAGRHCSAGARASGAAPPRPGARAGR